MKSKQPRPVRRLFGYSFPHSFLVTTGCPIPPLGGGILDEFCLTIVILLQSLRRAASCYFVTQTQPFLRTLLVLSYSYLPCHPFTLRSELPPPQLLPDMLLI